VARSIFLGAQALAMVSGGNEATEETYSLLESGPTSAATSSSRAR
jgi:hypothetical protein